MYPLINAYVGVSVSLIKLIIIDAFILTLPVSDLNDHRNVVFLVLYYSIDQFAFLCDFVTGY